MSYKPVIATNRFGLGAKPNEVATAKSDPQGWLMTQLSGSISFSQALTSREAFEALFEYRRARKQTKKQTEDAFPNNRLSMNGVERPGKVLSKQIAIEIENAIRSEKSFQWRMLDFFSNHFSVSTNGAALKYMAPTLKIEAIGPHLFGHFEDMLIAVAKHPVMLLYLNNEQSFGPNSKVGIRNKKRGLNENLAREILELHTLGVNGGYTQADVVELAKAITGWSIAGKEKKKRGYIFRSNAHEPGKRILLGNTYAEDGIKQGEQILRDLARHPSTANFISTKIARHLISDVPPQTLINAMSAEWLKTNGHLGQVIRVLISSKLSWNEQQQKFKTPREFLISSMRAIDKDQFPKGFLVKSLETLGQPAYQAGSPAGYGDMESDWNGSDAFLARVDWTADVAARSKVQAAEIAAASLGDLVSKPTIQAMSRAESQEQAVAILLMSPEFQRR